MIISIDTKKVFDKIQHLFMRNTFNRLGIEGNFLNLINGIYGNPISNTIFNEERLKSYPLRSGKRQGYLLLWLLFNIVVEVLARAAREENAIKCIQNRIKEVKQSLFADDMILYIGTTPLNP